MFDFGAARTHMVDSQIRTNDVTDHAIQKSFASVPREWFVPASKKAVAYSDVNIITDEGRSMMRPRDYAKLVQAAEIKATDIILDIACGRGYSTCVLGQLAETVIGLEDNDAYVEKATEMLTKAEVVNAAVVKGDLKGGAPEHGPFNVIFVNGAVSDVSKHWIDQLASGGRLVVVEAKGGQGQNQGQNLGQAKVYTKVGNAIGDRVVFDATAPLLPGFEPKAEFVF